MLKGFSSPPLSPRIRIPLKEERRREGGRGSAACPHIAAARRQTRARRSQLRVSHRAAFGRSRDERGQCRSIPGCRGERKEKEGKAAAATCSPHLRTRLSPPKAGRESPVSARPKGACRVSQVGRILLILGLYHLLVQSGAKRFPVLQDPRAGTKSGKNLV